MRYRYIIYPEAKSRLESSGLMKRIIKTNDERDFSFLGHISMYKIPEYISELNREGFIKTLMESGESSLIRRIDKAFNEPETCKWKVERTEGIVEEEIEPEDLLAISGLRASCILKPEEIWDYKRFGFENLGDFLGTFSAAMEEQLKNDSYMAGMKWQTIFPTGKIVVNEVTGDSNSDFRLHQTDITPYKTFDPLGNEVSYRPKFGDDNGGISAYHSVEGNFLVSILKWIGQTEIVNHQALEIKVREIISKTKSFGQHGGTTTEHFGGFDKNPMLLFAGFEYNIPKLQDGFKTNEFTPYNLGRAFEGYYGAYIHPNGKDLIYSSVPKDDKTEKREPSAHFIPMDAIPLIEATLYQCARGLGRTSARQVIDILEYYFSPKMKEDMEDIKKW
ncbi:MAG: hypothetical protein AABY15_09175 [Nanoarchaeota archaeon]